MREKRKRLEIGKVKLANFKPKSPTSTISNYQEAKSMLHQGYSTKVILKRFHLLQADKKNLLREEQLLNFQNPEREIIHEFEEVVSIPQVNIISKIHNDILGIFSSNENLRNFALPDVE